MTNTPTEDTNQTLLEILVHAMNKHPQLIPAVVEYVSPLKELRNSGLGASNPLVKYLMTEYCKGNGLEIGAGKFPYCDPKTTLFLDRFTENKDGTPRPDIVADATQIPRPDESFDYVFSSHVLEHMQDAIGALKEWLRVLRPDGILFLILPHADRTFDCHREKTTLEHHIQDHLNLTDAPDYSHNEEIKIGWSKLSTIAADSIQYQKEWGADVWDFEFRLKNGAIHFHVWTQNEIIRLLQYLGMNILCSFERVPEREDSFVVVARKSSRTN